jgi:hypothetical protein
MLNYRTKYVISYQKTETYALIWIIVMKIPCKHCRARMEPVVKEDLLQQRRVFYCSICNEELFTSGPYYLPWNRGWLGIIWLAIKAFLRWL